MPFVPVPATVKAQWFYTYNGQPCMNRLHISTPSTLPTASDCQVIANQLGNWWVNAARQLVPATCALREVLVQSIAEQNGPQATFVTGLPASGAHPVAALPSNVTFCVSLRSGLVGRSARGRWYWVGLAEDQVTDNIVEANWATDIVTVMQQLILDIDTLSSQPVIVSYISNGIPRPGGPVKFIVTTALAIDNVVDSQRGRLH